MKNYPTNNVYWFIPERFEKKLYNKKISLREQSFLPKYTKNLHNKSFSIIADCCVGGRIYHDYGVQFLSPFINLLINNNDFLELLSNVKFYLSSELVDITKENDQYPVGLLGGKIKIYFVHYKSFFDAKESWNRRLKRFNFNNIYVIKTDGLSNSHDKCERMTDEQIEKFFNLNFKKILITNNKDRLKLNRNDVIYLKKYKHRDMIYPFYINLVGKGETILEEYFDIISWLNS